MYNGISNQSISMFIICSLFPMFILCSVFIIRFSESFYLLSVVFLPVLALVKGLMKHGLFCPFFSLVMMPKPRFIIPRYKRTCSLPVVTVALILLMY